MCETNLAELFYGEFSLFWEKYHLRSPKIFPSRENEKLPRYEDINFIWKQTEGNIRNTITNGVARALFSKAIIIIFIIGNFRLVTKLCFRKENKNIMICFSRRFQNRPTSLNERAFFFVRCFSNSSRSPVIKTINSAGARS